ncbi:MAG: acetoin utilization protein AcuC [Fimbriimonadaceae bacterium]
MMSYDFGPRHPLKPIRLARTVSLLKAMVPDIELIDPGLASEQDILTVHSAEYLAFVRRIVEGNASKEDLFYYGFGSVDTPPFPGIYEAALAYCGGAVRAANRLNEGDHLAFNIGGGLHHAQRDRASGFCVFDDPAISLALMKKRFSKLLYVDIDLHHGDGVQAIFADDPDIVTMSIHESGKTLYPGTGFVEETGAGGAIVNLPMEANTSGDIWLWAFTEVFPRVLDHFQPEAIVLQMGCDAHFNDPLGHLRVSVQEWLGAVELVRESGLPTLACGGGGYDLTNVPRMWAAAVLTLAKIDVSLETPDDIPEEWGVKKIFDPEPLEQSRGRSYAGEVIEYWRDKLS